MKRILLLLVWTIILGSASIEFSATTEKISIKDVPGITEIEFEKPDETEMTKIRISFTNPFKDYSLDDKSIDQLQINLLRGGIKPINNGQSLLFSKGDLITGDTSAITVTAGDVQINIEGVSAGNVIFLFFKDKKLYYILVKPSDISKGVQKFVQENPTLFRLQVKTHAK